MTKAHEPDALGEAFLNNFLIDLRYALRTLAHSRGFTVVAVVTLALGIGANSTIFGLLNALLLRPLPYADADKIVIVFEKRIRENNLTNPVSPADYLDWKAQSDRFSAMAARAGQSADLIGAGEPERISSSQVTLEFFDVVGVRPALGRFFTAEEMQLGKDAVVVLSHGLWQERFGGSPQAIGQKINLSGRMHEIIGVLPASFQFWEGGAGGTRLWFPFAFPPDFPQVRAAHFLSVYARLKPGVTLAQAQAQMDAIGARLEQQYPSPNRGHGVNLVPLHEQLVAQARLGVLVLFGAVGLVLLIGCANVANLLLARAAARQRELAIRAALGASRGRLIRLLLTESALLTAASTLLGLTLAMWGIDALKSIIPGGQVSLGIFDFQLDRPVLLFTIALSFLTTALFAVLPAFQASRIDFGESLKEGGRSMGGSRARRRLRAVLVVAEVALSVFLLIGAGLLIRTFATVTSVNPGFVAQNVMSFQMVVPRNRYPSNERIAAFFDQLLGRVRGQSSVVTAGAISHLPVSGQQSRTGIEVEGGSPPENEPVRAHHRVVTPRYFETMRVPLMGGRLITEQDTANAPPVVLINQTAAKRYWPGVNAVGRRLKVNGPNDPPWREIIGVVGDVKHWGLDGELFPEMYLPQAQTPSPFMNIVVRTAGEPVAAAGMLREQVRAVDPDIAVSQMRTIEQVLERSVAGRRFTMLLLTLFSALAVVLAMVGIYGVMSYLVEQRTQEIGIRMALGARPQEVLRLVMREGMILAGIGLAIGLTGAFAGRRILTGLLFGVKDTDPATFVVASALLLTVAMLACVVPARRAMRVDPIIALRYE